MNIAYDIINNMLVLGQEYHKKRMEIIQQDNGKIITVIITQWNIQKYINIDHSVITECEIGNWIKDQQKEDDAWVEGRSGGDSQNSICQV